MSNASPPPEIRLPEPDLPPQREPDPPERAARCLNGCCTEPIVVPLGIGLGLCYDCARQRRLV